MSTRAAIQVDAPAGVDDEIAGRGPTHSAALMSRIPIRTHGDRRAGEGDCFADDLRGGAVGADIHVRR